MIQLMLCFESMGTTLDFVCFIVRSLRKAKTNDVTASARNLYPPSHMCLNVDCSYHIKGLKLQGAEQQAGVPFTLRGPI